MTDQVKRQELEELKEQVRQLEAELERPAAIEWPPTSYYGSYYATTGFLLGFFAALVSLMVNVIGAPVAGKNPLELIRVYLTFPLGDKALLLTKSAEKIYVVPDGVVLAFGCCLYILTGMFLGIIFQVAFSRLVPRGGLGVRLLLGVALGLVIWLINFYAILVWLQPMLLGGNWIVDQDYLPWWVAAGTHVVFGATMAVLYPFGRFVAYLNPTEQR